MLFLEELSRSLEFRWITRAARTNAAPRTTTNTNTGNSGRAPQTAAATDIRRRSCGLTFSYDSPGPAVPAELRGRIYFVDGTLGDGTVAPAVRKQVPRWQLVNFP